MSADGPPVTGQSQRDARLARVIEDVVARRMALDDLPDEAVIAAHRDLMPELGAELSDLRLVERARAAADGSTLRAAAGIETAPLEPARDQSIADSFPGYEIVREIHRGGQGVVYQAVQRGTHRKVAVKVLLEGPFASASTRRRFEREIDLVAQLKHSNIITIFDSGTTADGRMFFAMDYVRGVPLHDYVRDNKLTLMQALKLFGQVCEAVQYAHQKGVIHRDLKPSNVVVDSEGVPRLLDFGLAKQMAAGPVDTVRSLTGQVVGTLPYMSPEQARGNPDHIDTRTDVYALGVILYELLTGHYPYPVAGVLDEVLRNVKETPPTPPSRAWRADSGVAGDSDRKARAGKCPIDHEVQTIVLKALAKERERRYQSAGELAKDLAHYLAGEPIEAKRDSVGYVLRKLRRRYQLQAFVAATLVLVGSVATIWSFAGWQQARIQRDRAFAAERDQNRERERAQSALSGAEAARQREAEQRSVAEHQTEVAKEQAAIAQAVNEFLNTDLLGAVAPSAEKGKGVDVKMRDVLEEAAQRIEEAGKPGGRFADKPLVEASIRHMIGLTFLKLGVAAKAEPHLARAVELRREKQGPEHPETLSSMNYLANAYEREGKYAESRRLYEQVLQARRRVLGSEHRDTLASMNNWANAYYAQGKYADACKLYEQVLESRRRVLGPEHADTLRSMASLGLAYSIQGRYAEAQRRFEEVLEIQSRVLGPEHPDTLWSMGELAIAHSNQHEYGESERLSEQVLEIRRRVQGSEHPDTLWSMCALANVYCDQGRYAEGQRLSEQVLETRRRTLGLEHPDTLQSMNDLAFFYSRQGEYGEAQRLHEQVLETRRRTLGSDHPYTLTSIENLASAHCRQGKNAEAEALYRSALDARRRVSGASHPETSRVRRALIDLYIKQQRLEDARPLVAEQIQAGRADADDHDAPAKILNEYAWTLLTAEPADLRDPAAALTYARRAVEASGGKDGGIMDTLALAYHMTGDHQRAVETEEKALLLLPPGDSPTRTTLEANLARFRDAAATQPAESAEKADKPGTAP